MLFRSVAGVITGLVGRLQASEWLSWLASAFGWLTEALDTLLAWARDQVAALFAGLLQGFDALSPFLTLVLETVRKLITVAGDLMQLPLLILGGLWQRVPACIREPIERFIQEQVLARIPVFGQFFSDPELWPRVQATALGAESQIARIVRSIRQLDLKKAPSVSETLDWARTLVLLGIQNIDAEKAKETLHVLLKYQTDITKAAKELSVEPV